MPVFAGKSNEKVYVGRIQIKEVWAGGKRVYSTALWSDTFDSGTLDSRYVLQLGQAQIIDGELSRTRSGGETRVWTPKLGTDQLEIRAVLGAVTDPVQVSGLLLGSANNGSSSGPETWAVFEFNNRDICQIASWDGSGWPILAKFSPRTFAKGDTVSFKRVGQKVTATHNGVVLGSATTSSGAGYQQAALKVACYSSGGFFPTYYYSPRFDSFEVASSV